MLWTGASGDRRDRPPLHHVQISSYRKIRALVGEREPPAVSRPVSVVGEVSGFPLSTTCPCRKLNRAGNCGRITQSFRSMREGCRLVWSALVGLFRSKASLQAEILVLRNIQRRHLPKRQTFSATDRLIFAVLYRLVPTVTNALAIVKPETVIKWHRAGVKSYWRWRSRHSGGRPTIPLEIRQLIREMSIANPLWGAPRIHGELLKLGIDIGQTRRGWGRDRRLRYLLGHAA